VTTEPLDTDYLTGWSLDRQRTAQAAAEPQCPRCRHPFHGLPCVTFRGNGCPCASSFAEVAS
jgi:hypothetical protein